MALLIALLPIMAVVLFATLYAHRTLASESRSAASASVTRVVLLTTAAGFACVTALLYGGTWPQQLIVGLTSFGVVHGPAACILFLKRLRARQS